MEIVLGVSMTPTTVRMVLVEGENADGVTIDNDVFDLSGDDGSATSSASEQVASAVLGTQESADAGGHHLTSTGVTWSDHASAAGLRDALAAQQVEDVLLVSELHAAGALARAVGRTVGYQNTALMLIDRDSATLSVVESSDGSIVKVDSRSLHNDDAMDVIAEMATTVEASPSPPEGMFVVGSGVDVAAVRDHLEPLVGIPVSAPEEPELALARGAALASANAPRFDASTVGLAYSQDPDGTTAGKAYGVGLSAADTQLAPAPDPVDGEIGPIDHHVDERKPFLLVGSSLTAIFVVGVVALVISLAVSIRPTVGARPGPAGENVVHPSSAAPAAVVPDAQRGGPPPAQAIQEAVPVVQQQQSASGAAVQAPAPQQAPNPAPAQSPPAPAVEAPAGPLPAPVDVPPVPGYAPPGYAPPPFYLSPPIIGLPPRWRESWRRPPGDEPPPHYPGSYPGPGGYPGGPGGYPGRGPGGRSPLCSGMTPGCP